MSQIIIDVPSESTAGLVYQVTLMFPYSRCTCPVYLHKLKNCKHMQMAWMILTESLFKAGMIEPVTKKLKT